MAEAAQVLNLDTVSANARRLAMQDLVRQEVASWRSQIRKGTLELAVLVLLRRKRAYGLELVEALNAEGMGISEGSIYPLLSRLRNEGKVTTTWVDEGSGHAHKVYDLTSHGAKVTDAMLVAWKEFADAFSRLTDGGKKR